MNTMIIHGKPVSLKGFTEAIESMKVGEKLTIEPIGKGWRLVAEKVAMTAEENSWDETPAEGWIFIDHSGPLGLMGGASIWDETGEGFTWAEFKRDESGRFPHNAVYLKPRFAYFSIKRWWKQEEE